MVRGKLGLVAKRGANANAKRETGGGAMDRWRGRKHRRQRRKAHRQYTMSLGYGARRRGRKEPRRTLSCIENVGRVRWRGLIAAMVLSSRTTRGRRMLVRAAPAARMEEGRAERRASMFSFAVVAGKADSESLVGGGGTGENREAAD